MAHIRSQQEYKIRLATENDAEAISEVILASIDGTYAFDDDQQRENAGKSYSPEGIKQAFFKPGLETYVAETPEGEVVSVSTIMAHRPEAIENLGGHTKLPIDSWFVNLFTKPKHQRTGVGSQLFYVGAKRLENQGKRAIGWVVRTQANQSAIEYYESLGAKYVCDNGGEKVVTPSPRKNLDGSPDHYRYAFELEVPELRKALKARLERKGVDLEALDSVISGLQPLQALLQK